MTPKEKAKELVKQYEPLLYQGYGDLDGYNIAKKCALICINEMIDFASKQGIREPIMYLNMVKREVSLL